ncbi:MAG: zinc-binding dehydrogenase [Pseudomonadales bacterium]
MRAVLMERGKLWVEQMPTPEPGPGEVLVRTRACGICGSDLHAARHTEAFVKTSREAGGAFKLTTFDPVVMGHEFAAEVVDYGPDTQQRYPAGTLVTSVPMLLREPATPVGYTTEAPGGFGEYMVLSERLLLQVPGGLPATHAAFTEPMAVGLHAVRKARLQGNEVTIVQGCGPVGLAVITALRAQGAGPIIAADFSAARRALAETQGAHQIVDPSVTDPFALAAAQGRDNTTIFECVGVPGMLDAQFVGAPANAQIVVVGVCLQHDSLRPLIAINKELRLQFVLGYSLDEFRDTLHGIADGTFQIEPLITETVALEGVADAFDRLANPDAQGKVLVLPNGPSP